ncbi:MAG: hypothetical protein M3R36_16035 [Bacteroidota bacterium]|nr:hypothetical protein [Bacteroidota bacterium]
MVKKLFLTVILFIFISSNLFAQKSKTSDLYSDLQWSNNKPSIEVSYGLSDINLNGDNFNLANAGLIELKLGFTSQRKSKYGNNILNYHNRYLFLSNASSDNSAKSNNSGVQNNMWRFGLGNKQGYGIKMGSFSIMPYNSNSFAWTQFQYTNPDAVSDPQNIYAPLNDFNDAFRFGSTAEAGINFQLNPGLSIQPKYEIADIYPRHLFGKQFMSSIIEIGGMYAIDGFTKRILRNTPVAGTIVNFILKNAYEYGFYQLCKNQMNWPFASAAPLRYETFKLGMTFTF